MSRLAIRLTLLLGLGRCCDVSGNIARLLVRRVRVLRHL